MIRFRHRGALIVRVLTKAAIPESPMSYPIGKSILQSLAQFVSRRWPSKDIEALAVQTAKALQHRNEITGGGVVSAGTGTSSSACVIDMTAMSAVLNGRISAGITAQDDTDLFTTSGSVGKAIYSNGADASGISLANPSTAKFTLIVCNSDGAGGADETDAGAPLLVAVVSGTATALGTAHLTSKQIQDALDASTGVHDGVTGWAHVSQHAWSRTGASAWTHTVTKNRNNVIQDA